MKVTSEQLCDELLRLFDRLRIANTELAERHNLTKVQLFALYCIERRRELPMGQVAEILHCDASNITGVVDRLVSQGLVVRQEDPSDRRTKQLQLTQKGRQTVQSIKAELPSVLGCDRLSTDEHAVLMSLIQKVIA